MNGVMVQAVGLALWGGLLAPVPTASTVPTVPPLAAVASIGAPPAKGVSSPVLRLYFLQKDKLAVTGRTAPATKALGRAAMLRLLSGPSPAEAARGMTTCIPAGTRLLGLSVANRTATVDLSRTFQSGGGSLSMTARLAQVVYTLTQFPTVSRVVFWEQGHRLTVFGGEGIMLDRPSTRADFGYVTPPILVESPTPGRAVSSPVRVSGTSDVLEAGLWVSLTTASGQAIAKRHLHALAGPGTPGTFSASIAYPSTKAGKAFVVAYDLSPKDGHRQNVVRVPVILARS